MAQRLVGIAIALAMTFVGLRPAEACGYWQMKDEERGFVIGFLINSGVIKKGEKRLGAIYLDTDNKAGLRSVKERKVVFDIRGTKLLKYGKRIATIDASGNLAFGRRVYVIELTNKHELHDMPAWDLAVKRGDKLVLSSTEASALCAPMHRDPPWTEEQTIDEVRRRVMFYLAWRETGG